MKRVESGTGIRWLVGLLLALAGMVSAVQTITHPFRSITLIDRSESHPRPLRLHIALIDLRVVGLRFKVSPPGGTRETLRQTTLDFLTQEQAQLAINAHFYLPFTTPDLNANLVGFAASEGRLFSAFEPQPIASEFESQQYAIVPQAPALNLDRLNRATLLHSDPKDRSHRRTLEQAEIWNAVAGSAQIVQNGIRTIPTYTGLPEGLTPASGYSDRNSWYNVLRARTAIGLTADRETLVLFTVDEAGGSLGMTVYEVADWLIRDYRVADALNLDGDGSTSMAGMDPRTHQPQWINTPSDGVRGRAVGSSLAVFAPGGPELTRDLTITVLGDREVLVSWPLDQNYWELQHTGELLAPTWRPAIHSATAAHGRWQALLTNTTQSTFYRLVRR